MDGNGCLATHYATSCEFDPAASEVGRGHLGVLRLLLGAGVEAAATDAAGGQALHYAAANGHVAAVEALVEVGADINAADLRGWRCLSYFVDGLTFIAAHTRRGLPDPPRQLLQLLRLGASAALASEVFPSPLHVLLYPSLASSITALTEANSVRRVTAVDPPLACAPELVRCVCVCWGGGSATGPIAAADSMLPCRFLLKSYADSPAPIGLCRPRLLLPQTGLPTLLRQPLPTQDPGGRGLPCGPLGPDWAWRC